MSRSTEAPARIVNGVLGIWLLPSAFLWPRTEAQRTSTRILGSLPVIFAVAALYDPMERYLDTARAESQ